MQVAKANQTDGYRMVTALVVRKLGRAVNRKRVLRVMRQRRLIQRRRRLDRRRRPGFFRVTRPDELCTWTSRRSGSPSTAGALVGHPRPPALAHVQGLKPSAVHALLQPVVGRAVHPHRPARRRHVAQLVGQREQAKTQSDEHVMLRHRLPFDWFGDPETEPTRRRPRPAGRGRLTSTRYRSRNRRCCKNSGLVRPSRSR